MEEMREHIWHVMLWEFKNNKTTQETAKKILTDYCQNVITDRQIQNWYSKFCYTSLRA